VVLESYRQTEPVSCIGQEDIVTKLLTGGQVESRVVRIPVDIVKVDSVEPFALAHLSPGRHDAPERAMELGDIQPSLTGPATVRLAEQRPWAFAGVGTPVLPGTGVDVTHHPARCLSPVERGDDGHRGVEPVHLDHLDVRERPGRRRVELDLPAFLDRRPPARLAPD